MSNFDVELTALVNDWLNRGADTSSMREALMDELDRLSALNPAEREK